MNTPIGKATLLLLGISLLALFTVFCIGCATARGFGRDLGHVGHGIERAVR